MNGPYALTLHSMGLVDKNNHVNLYDGKVRVVDTLGQEICKYSPEDYRDHVSKHLEPWSYLKFPYLKKYGWKGLVEGQESGVYHATPLSRLNAADGMATPQAQKEYDRMYETLGGKPVHATFAMHWARLIELLYSAERYYELATDEDITGRELRASDPCFSCATHSLPGDMPMIVEINGSGQLPEHQWKNEHSLHQCSD